MSIVFEEPNFGANKYKVTITATAFVDNYPSGIEIKIFGDNKVGKHLRLNVEADPLGREVYNFFKSKIFRGLNQTRELTKTGYKMIADWSIKPEELEKVLRRARNNMGHEWEQVFKKEKTA